MEMTPIVSVIVQTYQHAPFIRQCLDGILMQETDFPIELIVGEDESTDGTREICMEYAERYPDIIWLFLRSRKDVIYINGMATGRYNFMENLKAARGKYIALCEGDDYWTDSRKLQKQVDFMEANPGVVLCYGDATAWNEEKHVSEGRMINGIRKPQIGLKQIVQGNQCITCTVLFHRDALVIPPRFTEAPYGDWALYSLLAQHGNIAYLDEVFACYRIHGGGLFSKLGSIARRQNEIQTQRIINRMTGYKFARHLFPIIVRMLTWLIEEAKKAKEVEIERQAKKWLWLELLAVRNWRYFKHYRPGLIKAIR